MSNRSDTFISLAAWISGGTATGGFVGTMIDINIAQFIIVGLGLAIVSALIAVAYAIKEE